MSGFKQFLFRGNVIDLAVAVIIGVAFGAVVTAFVKDLVTPLIGIFGGVPDFSALSFSVNNSKFLIGDFINELLSFIVIAAVIYFVVIVPMNRLTARNRPVTGPTTKDCPECLSTIPLEARRCAFCTTVLASA